MASTGGTVRRVGLLAPMPSERAPLVRTLELTKGEVGGEQAHVGRVGDVEAVVMMTGIGTALARLATERMLRAADVDHVMVVGVCGGVDPDLGVGDILIPEVVADHVSGQEFVPDHLGPIEPKGRLVTTDELLLGEEIVASLRADGVTGLDMETSAVAAVCEEAGIGWSVVRSPSDHADDDLIDEAVAKMANVDGSPNVGAIARYLLPKPWRIAKMSRLGRDLKKATSAASRTAKEALEHVGQS